MNHPTYSLSGVQHPNRREGFERRDERTQQQWLDEVHAVRNPLRFDRREKLRRGRDIDSAYVADVLECGGPDRHAHVHATFAAIFKSLGV